MCLDHAINVILRNSCLSPFAIGTRALDKILELKIFDFIRTIVYVARALAEVACDFVIALQVS